MRAIVVAAAALGMVTTMASAQDTSKDENVDRFQLFAKCKPVLPTVTLELTSAYLENLEEAELEQVVLTGLRAARLLSDQEAPPFLFVTVGVVHWAFSVRVELMKELRDPLTQLRGGATTWRAHRYGVHSGDKSFVLSSLSSALGVFVDEYRRVNGSACPSAGDPQSDSAPTPGESPAPRMVSPRAPDERSKMPTTRSP